MEGTLPAGSFTDDILHVCVLRGHALQWSSLALHGVVTYMSQVEAFPTGIKIKSSDQSPYMSRVEAFATRIKIESSDQRGVSNRWNGIWNGTVNVIVCS